MAQVLNGGGSAAAAPAPADAATTITPAADDSSSARLAFIANVLIGYKVEAQVRFCSTCWLPHASGASLVAQRRAGRADREAPLKKHALLTRPL